MFLGKIMGEGVFTVVLSRLVVSDTVTCHPLLGGQSRK